MNRCVADVADDVARGVFDAMLGPGRGRAHGWGPCLPSQQRLNFFNLVRLAQGAGELRRVLEKELHERLVHGRVHKG